MQKKIKSNYLENRTKRSRESKLKIDAGQHTEEVKSSHLMPQSVPALKAAQGEAVPPPKIRTRVCLFLFRLLADISKRKERRVIETKEMEGESERGIN